MAQIVGEDLPQPHAGDMTGPLTLHPRSILYIAAPDMEGS